MEDVVTEFMICSTLKERRPNIRNLEAMAYCAKMSPAGYKLASVTGSIGELYIEPMLPCIGDIDVMTMDRERLAVPAGQQPPTHLPDVYCPVIFVFEIHDSMFDETHYPGYVYLLSMSTIRRQTAGVEYTVEKWHNDSRWLPHYGLGEQEATERTNHGPANLETHRYVHKHYYGSVALSEFVVAMLCPMWPHQATEWPRRSRMNGWPERATIEEVVKNGCDLVQISHRRCRRLNSNRLQWRLSFSRAEVTLLNSWTPVQQTVYHMLRFFAKTERLSDITDPNGEKMISNYHIKTVMMWAAELKPTHWWNNNLNLVRICRQLLCTMAAWIDEEYYKQYFIPQCNLVDWERRSQQSDILVSRLESTRESNWLAEWFINNYIKGCADKMNISFSGTTAIPVSSAAIGELSSRCIRAIRGKQLGYIDAVCTGLAFTESVESLDTSSLPNICRGQQRVVSYLRFACGGVFCLHAVRRLRTSNQLDRKSLYMACLAFDCIEQGNNERIAIGGSSLSIGLQLMECQLCVMSPVLKQLQTELANAYLELTCVESDGSVYGLTLICVAARYYTLGEYRSASDHSRKLAELRIGHPENIPLVAAEAVSEVLISTDANIVNALGLVALFQYVHIFALKRQPTQQQQQQPQHMNITVQLFACYLYVKCLLKIHSGDSYNELLTRFRHYSESLLVNAQPYITDVILHQLLYARLKSIIPESIICMCPSYHISTSSRPRAHQKDTADSLEQLLVESAVELLADFRREQLNDFGPHGLAVLPNEFRAMLAFKQGQFQQCNEIYRADLCKLMQIPLLWNTFSHAIFRSFFPLLDDDLILLRGLLSLIVAEATVDFWQFSSLTLMLYLLAKCWMKSADIRRSTNVKERLRHLVIAYNAFSNLEPVSVNTLILEFVYRQLILRARKRG